MPVDKFYVNLYSEIRFICPNFSEGVSMYMLNRLTRRGYYQKIPFLPEIAHLQDCLIKETTLKSMGIDWLFDICHLADYNLNNGLLN